SPVVAPGAYSTPGSPNISPEDVAACGGNSEPPVEIFGFNIAAAGGEFDIVVLRHIHFHRDPQTAAALASGSLSAQVYTLGSLARIHRKAFQKQLRVFLRRVSFEAHTVVNLVRFLGVNHHVAQSDHKMKALAILRGNGTIQLRSDARAGFR